jgi:hypothetical protein
MITYRDLWLSAFLAAGAAGLMVFAGSDAIVLAAGLALLSVVEAVWTVMRWIEDRSRRDRVGTVGSNRRLVSELQRREARDRDARR